MADEPKTLWLLLLRFVLQPAAQTRIRCPQVILGQGGERAHE